MSKEKDNLRERMRLRLESYGDGLDEIAFGGWLHVERMSKRNWFVSVGEYAFNVRMGKRGGVKVQLFEWPDGHDRNIEHEKLRAEVAKLMRLSDELACERDEARARITALEGERDAAFDGHELQASVVGKIEADLRAARADLREERAAAQRIALFAEGSDADVAVKEMNQLRLRAEKAEAEVKTLFNQQRNALERCKTLEDEKEAARAEAERLRELNSKIDVDSRDAWREVDRLRPVVKAVRVWTKAEAGEGDEQLIDALQTFDARAKSQNVTPPAEPIVLDDPPPDGVLCIVFDGPPNGGTPPRFVECEIDGKSRRVGDWRKRDDGLWELRINESRSACHGVATPDGAPDVIWAWPTGQKGVFGWASGIGEWLTENHGDNAKYLSLDYHNLLLREAADRVCGLFEAGSTGEWDGWVGSELCGYGSGKERDLNGVHDAIRAAIYIDTADAKPQDATPDGAPCPVCGGKTIRGILGVDVGCSACGRRFGKSEST